MSTEEELWKKLQENEKSFKSFMDSAVDNFILLDSKLNIIDINKETLISIGLSEKKIIGKNIVDLYPDVKESNRYDEYMEVLRTDKPLILEDVVTHPKYGKKHYRVKVFKVEGSLGTISTDITERKLVEEKLKQTLVELKKSEEMYEDLYENAPDMYASIDQKTAVIIRCNKTFAQNLGYTKERIVGRPVFEIYHPDCMEDVKKTLQSFKKTGKVQDVELQVKRKDGSKIEVSLNASAVRDKQGNVIYSVSALRDITKRKRIELELQKQYTYHKELIKELRRQSNVTEAINKVLQEALTCETLEEVGKICLSIGEDLTSSKFGFIGLINEAGLFDTIAISDPGFAACKLPGSEKIELISNMNLDGIDRSTMREGKSRIVNDPANHPDSKGTPKGHPQITAFLGVPFKRWGETIGMIGMANKERGYEAADQSAIEAISVAFVEVLKRMQKEKENSNKINLMVEELKKHKNQLEEMVEQRTEELQDAQDELEIILDNVPGLIFYKDTENKYIRVNKVIADAHNMTKEEMVNKSLFDLYPNDEAQNYWDDDLEVIKSGKPKLNIEEPWDTPEGRSWINSSKIPFKDEKGVIIGIVGFSTDITERKKMEEELKRSEKLAILGQLAGGVGHELRNPLGAIKNAAFFLNMALEESESEVRESLKIIDEEVETSEKIISSLLDFARPKPLNKRIVDVNDIIQKAFSRTSIPKRIKVVKKFDKKILPILVDPDQLIQVFINIISNAVQAMPKTGQMVVESEILDKRWVAISFTDNGVGISKENLEKLFEPLFTTKTKGIGLGLAVSKTLVEGHNGSIEVQSKIGKGSTFIIKLPINGKGVV